MNGNTIIRGNRTMNASSTMSWERIEGNWARYRVTAKSRWTRLSDDQLEKIAGDRERLALGIQAAYIITRETTERQLAQWQADQREDPNVPEAGPGSAEVQ
jgi:uncharacterized protein YjbJ (UPF0337 family)